MWGGFISPPLNTVWDRLHTKVATPLPPRRMLPISQCLSRSPCLSPKTMFLMKPVCVLLVTCVLHRSHAWWVTCLGVGCAGEIKEALSSVLGKAILCDRAVPKCAAGLHRALGFLPIKDWDLKMREFVYFFYKWSYYRFQVVWGETE